MSIAVIAEPDFRERLRCLKIIGAQTSMNAIGAASWGELEQAFEASGLGLVVYTSSLPGAPSDAVDQMLGHTQKLVIALETGQEVTAPDSVIRTPRPVPEETLVLCARGSERKSRVPGVNFNPIDFIQMLCMSGASQVLVISQDGADTGVIELREGEVWTAFDSLGVGEEAFARLIRPEMRARLGPTHDSSKERTVLKGLHELMLDSLRRIDEGTVSRPPPLSASQLEVATSSSYELARRVTELSAEARQLLMARNYDAAARTLIHLAELDPASHLVRANLEQLRRLGYPK